MCGFFFSGPVGCLALILSLTACERASTTSRHRTISGTIESDEVRVASRYGGRVEQIVVSEGATLKTGAKLMQLEAPELRARHDQASAWLAELKAGPRPQEIQAARSEWEALQANLDLAQAENKRITALFSENLATAAERDRAMLGAAALEKNVAAAKSRLDLQLAGTRPERIAQAEAQLREIDTQLAEMSITAPSDSVLEVLTVRGGDVIGPNREVATLLLTSPLWVRVFVPEPWLGKIETGTKVSLRVDSFPERMFAGEVIQVARAAEFTPRNAQTVEERIKQVFGVKIRLENPDGALRAGMSADVEFPGLLP